MDPNEVLHQRLFDHEKRLHFRGEIHEFRVEGLASVVFAKVDSTFSKWTGGTHCAEFQPIHPNGWKNFDDFVEKIARKALLMRTKSLIHGLPFGGSKGGIGSFVPLTRENRLRIVGELWPYALNYFEGKVHSGADVNIGLADVMLARARTPYVFGLSKEYGGCGDPSPNTAFGVEGAIRAYLDVQGYRYWHMGLSNFKMAIKGCGKVGMPLLRSLYLAGAQIAYAEINEDTVQEISVLYPKAKRCSSDAIHAEKVDIFIPCDADVTITEQTVDEFRCNAIIGAANDQCRDPQLEDRLHKNGTLHLTDSLANGGGLITIEDESRGYDHTRARAKIQANVIDQSRRVMQESQETGVPCSTICERLVQEQAERTGNSF